MKEKLYLIECLCKDVKKNVDTFIEQKAEYRKSLKRYEEGSGYYPIDETFGNKNYSKSALERKITYLRHELLNLKNMLADE